MLIKGPIVYALLAPGLVAFQWWTRKNAAVPAASPGRLPWLLSFLVFLVWFAGGILFVPEFIEHVVLREFAGRFNDEVHRAQPIYFYLPHLLHRFAPWRLLLIGFGFFLWKGNRGGWNRKRSGCLGSLGGLLVLSFILRNGSIGFSPSFRRCLLLGAIAGGLRSRERSGRSSIERAPSHSFSQRFSWRIHRAQSGSPTANSRTRLLSSAGRLCGTPKRMAGVTASSAATTKECALRAPNRIPGSRPGRGRWNAGKRCSSLLTMRSRSFAAAGGSCAEKRPQLTSGRRLSQTVFPPRPPTAL
jgi:hypothetical protein